MVHNYNCGCPVCGHTNRYVDLVETNGEMECEQCHVLITVTKPFGNFAFSEEERLRLKRAVTCNSNPAGKILHITVDPSAKKRKQEKVELAAV